MRTIVLHPYIKSEMRLQPRTPEACLDEAIGLAGAISLEIADSLLLPISKIKPATLLGSGKIEELAEHIKSQDIHLAIIDTHLTPIQQRNLEKALNCKVIDRTALILEIFGERAATREGKLQVELAALNYQKSRLVRSWTHLERQRGGFGFVGGPGESQIELDRRIISDRIVSIKKQLEKVVRTRGLHRKLRHDTPFPLVALVGYTNAGKSTLFNHLTKADVFVEDALFATLDPTIRKITLPSGLEIILSDTVGFISDLPTDLISAFRATLEEVLEADLILHVRDISHPDSDAQRKDVQKVMDDLIGKEEPTTTLEVLNKIDLLPKSEKDEKLNSSIAISAITGDGVEDLLNIIDKTLAKLLLKTQSFTLPCSAGKEIAWLYQHGQVLEYNELEDEKIQILVQLSTINSARFNTLLNSYS